MQVIIRSNVLDGIKEDEKAAYAAKLVQVAAEKPVKDWEAEMAKADKDMPRYAENIIASMDAEQFARLDKKTQLDYNTKIAKRAEKP